MTNQALVNSLDALVQESVVVAQNKLVEFAADRDVFETALIEVFGSLFEPQVADQLRQSLIDGSFDWPQVAVRSAAELQGALGVYATQSRTIYLSASFLANNVSTPDNITAVLLEEFGHDFDARLNPGHDALGDEGAIFSVVVRGQDLSEEQLQQLRSENDWATIELDGVQTSIEMATASTGSTGGSQPFNNLQPYATHNYIIALQGVFPSRNLSSEPFIGAVEEFAGDFAPRGWALCQGQLLPIAQNQALFAILGTTYGGNGTTNFALPDLRGRTPVGVGNNVTLGQKIGTETVTLTTANLPAHSHTTFIAGVPTTAATGGGQSFSNWQPSLALTPVIALQGIFPARNLGTDEVLGGVSWFAGNFAPRGYAVANGQLLSIAQNTALFSLLGTNYGGDGRTTFALPDLRGRTPVQAGSGPGLSEILLGEMGGIDTVTLTTANLPNHSHTIPSQANSGTTGGGQPFDNRQPYLGLNYVVALEGIYPSRPLGAESDPTSSGGLTPDVSGLVNGHEILSEEVALQKINDLSRVAISLWAAAGIGAAQIATLETAKYQIANLAPGSLAFAGEDNVVTIDTDASNRGWFVDETPADSVEYGTTDPVTGELYATDPNASGHFDLLTAILHEQGHILGFSHTSQPGKLMYGSLGVGGRLLPTVTDMVESSPMDTSSPFLSGGGTEYLGGVSMFAGNFAPRGFAFANGQLLPISENTALFSLLGTTYGGDGQTTFALPDFRGRTAIGMGQGPGTSNYGLGQAGGSETTTLTVSQMPAHSHTFTSPTSPPTLAAIPAPAAVPELVNAAAQNLAAITGNLTVQDLDVGDTLTATVVGSPVLKLNGSTTLPGGVNVSALTAAGVFTLGSAVTANGNSQSIGYTYDPATANLDFLKANDSLTVTYTLKVNDGTTDSGTQDLTFTITGTNDVPYLTDPAAAAILPEGIEKVPYTITKAQLLQGFSDLDVGQAATLAIANLTSPQGTFTLSGDTYTFLPTNPNYFGAVSLTYQVKDIDNGAFNAANNFTLNPFIEAAGRSALAIVNGKYVVVDLLTKAVTNLKYTDSFGTRNVGPNSYPGWSVIGAEIVGAEVNAIWKDTAGNFWYSNNSDTIDKAVTAAEIVNYEADFKQDFNNDGFFGPVIEIAGTTKLGLDINGNYIAKNSNNTVNLKYTDSLGTRDIGPNSYPGWSVIGAEIVGAEVNAIWKDIAGDFWYSNNSDTIDKAVTAVEIVNYEAAFNQDLNGDGFITTIGTAGNDRLGGKNPNELLIGGAGVDTFVLKANSGGVTKIADFQPSELLDVVNFSLLNVDLLTIMAVGTPTGTAANQFIFNSNNGDLYFDTDGAGSSVAVKLATLEGVSSLLPSNFFIG